MEQQNKKQDIYKGNVTSEQYNGEATFIIDEAGLTVETAFSGIAFGYEQIKTINRGDYEVKISTEQGDICCNRLGQSNDWFCESLLKSYNKAVTKALKVKGECLFETRGLMNYEGMVTKGVIQIYEDCICLLPPGVEARRFPFSFITTMKKENYSLTMYYSTGERVTLSMVGRDFDSLEKCIIERVRAQREKNSVLATHICETLTTSETAKAASIILEKLAVPIEDLMTIQGLYDGVIEKIKASEANYYWNILMELCDNEKMAVGIWEIPEEEATKWMIWLAVPSKNEKIAIIEAAFPGEDVATYIYNIPYSWDEFLVILNRGMEAMDFDRENITISDAELISGNNAGKKMLIHRTPDIQVLRKQFSGRIIHHSCESWKKKLIDYIG